MDAIYPGTFNLSKVKWTAKFDYEFVENYKVLQNAFDKNGIKKHIDVNNTFKSLLELQILITNLLFRLTSLSKQSIRITLKCVSGLKDTST